MSSSDNFIMLTIKTGSDERPFSATHTWPDDTEELWGVGGKVEKILNKLVNLYGEARLK